MTIRAKLLLASLIALGILLLSVSFVVVQNRAVNKAIVEAALADDLAMGVFQLNLLLNDYLLHRGQRASRQWWSRYQGNGQILIEAESSLKSNSQEFMGILRERHEKLAENFSRLENVPASGMDDATSPELEKILAGQLSIDAQAMFSRAVVLARHRRHEVSTQQWQLVLVLVTTVAVLALAVPLGSWIVIQGVLKPLKTLQAGTKILGVGNLSHRIGTTKRDEFGQLAGAFDQMAEDLSASTASRDELEKEVAERKRAEAVLAQQAEELERSNQELDSFAHTASHDLKAPARRMAQFCELLERKYKGVLDEQASKYISIIADNAAQMRVLIDDVLVFAKAGTEPREAAAVDLNAVALLAKSNLSVEIAERGAEVQIENLPTVAGHETDILLLFQNLIANAVKFCRENTPKVTVTARLNGDAWDIEVRDNGIGIDAKNQECIFAPLTRLHTDAEYQGSGIGLATCKKIVERNGGGIRVRSAVGRGSSFYFTFPASTTNEAA